MSDLAVELHKAHLERRAKFAGLSTAAQAKKQEELKIAEENRRRLDAQAKFRLEAILAQYRQREMTPEHAIYVSLIAEVGAKHSVSRAQIEGKTREPRIVCARHEFWYRLRFEKGFTMSDIGRRMGHKDHTTVYAGIKSHMKRNGL